MSRLMSQRLPWTLPDLDHQPLSRLPQVQNRTQGTGQSESHRARQAVTRSVRTPWCVCFGTTRAMPHVALAVRFVCDPPLGHDVNSRGLVVTST